MYLERIANPPRGCGQLVKGGCYAQGTLSSSGTLNAWTWCLGEGVIGGANYNVTCPPRMMDVIRLPETLQAEKLMKEEAELAFTALRRLKPFALLDHVGDKFYSPYQFAEECRAFGPSRRIPQKIAASIAKHTPIPIVFTHTKVPVVDVNVLGSVLQFCGVSDEAIETLFFFPVHTHQDWGLTTKDWNGHSHWLVPLLRKLAQSGNKHLTQVLPPELAEETLFSEQIFGISWVTRVVYVANGDETVDDLSKLLELGIQPVTIEEEDDGKNH